TGPSSSSAACLLTSLLGSALLLGATTPADDHLVALLALARTTLRNTVRVDRMTSTGLVAFTTTQRVIHGVHRNAAYTRPFTTPPVPAGLAPLDVRVLGVSDLTHGRTVTDIHVPDLGGGHPQLGVAPFLGDQLNPCPGGTGDLGAAARPQLDRVDHRPDRDVPQRKIVARFDVRTRAVLDFVTLIEPLRRQDVALLAVGVVQQRDAGRAVRVVLDVRHLRGYAVLVVAAEVHDTVRALVPTTLVSGGHPATRVPTTLVVQRPDQRLLRMVPGDLREVGDARLPPACRYRFVVANCHL